VWFSKSRCSMYRLKVGLQSRKVSEAAYARLPLGLIVNIAPLLVRKLFAGYDTR
jgi:hypothetical protein